MSKGPLRTPDKEKKSKVPMNTYNEMMAKEGKSPRTPTIADTASTKARSSPESPPSPYQRAFAKRSDTARERSEKKRVNLTSASARINQYRSKDQNFRNMISDLAAQEPTGISLNEFYKYGEDNSPSQRLHNRKFLYHELPIRIAQRVVELESLPHGLSEKQPIRDLAKMYSGYVRKIINLDRPEGASEEEDQIFTNTLQSIFLEHSSVVQQMATGILEFRDEIRSSPTATWDQHIQEDVDEILNRFYTARIGLRMLVENYITSRENKPGFSGVIEKECNLSHLAAGAAQDAVYLANLHLGDAPEITVHGALDATFTYVPSHIHYCLTEILKNSVRATVEEHRRKGEVGEMPPVRIIIASGHEDMTIKVSDEGGGIPRSDIHKVWTYLHSTAKRPSALSDDAQSNRTQTTSALAGYGMGMPLSRLYAEYFGGSMDVKSMECIGTDAYLHLNRLGHKCEIIPSVVVNSPGNLTSQSSERSFGAPSELSSREKVELFYDSGLAGN